MATLLVPPTRHRHTETLQWNTYQPTTYVAQQEGGRDWTKPSTKWQQPNATTLCEELRASNCVYKS